MLCLRHRILCFGMMAVVAITACVRTKTARADAAQDAKAAREKAAAVVAGLRPAKGDVQLTGMYRQQRMAFFGRSMSLTYEHYYFLEDGRVFFGTPPGGTVTKKPGDDEWAALVKADPAHCGTYLVRGDQITFRWGGNGGAPKAMKFGFEKPGDSQVLLIDTLGAVKVESYKDDEKLDAAYEGGANISSNTHNAFLASSGTYDFHPDGTFTRAGLATYDSDRRTPSATASAASTKTGTYTLSGNTLTLTAGKETAKYTVYPWTEAKEKPAMRMYFNGTMFTRERPAKEK